MSCACVRTRSFSYCHGLSAMLHHTCRLVGCCFGAHHSSSGPVFHCRKGSPTTLSCLAWFLFTLLLCPATQALTVPGSPSSACRLHGVELQACVCLPVMVVSITTDACRVSGSIVFTHSSHCSCALGLHVLCWVMLGGGFRPPRPGLCSLRVLVSKCSCHLCAGTQGQRVHVVWQ